MSDDSLIGKGARQLSREDRAIEICKRAMKLVDARGGAGHQPETREYTKAGLKIQQSRISDTNRLIVTTERGMVMLSVEWEASGRARVLSYTPGLWETRLKHLTRGAL